MTAVKGSAQYRMVVMPYRPMRRVFNYFFSFMLLLLVAVVCFFYGYGQGATQQPLQDGAVNQRVEELEQEAEALRQELANVKLAAAVDEQSQDDLRRQAVEQKVRISELERDVSVYRSMVSKTDTKNPSGISVGAFHVSGSGGVRGYRYKLVVQQLVFNDEKFKGALSLKIVGVRANQAIVIPLHQASMQVSEELIPLEFKYFQSIEGDLLLPEGFEPKRIDVVVRSTDKKKSTHVERQLDWSIAS